MATNYSELQTEIIDWSVKQGDTAFSAMVPNFIKYAEAQINRDLRIRLMEKTSQTVITTADGVVPLPDDFREFRAVAALTNPITPLDYVSPQSLNVKRASLQSGNPTCFSVIANNMVVFPVPNSGTTTLEITYFASIPALSVTTPTNAMLTNNPDVYLFASLMLAAQYSGDIADNPQLGIISSYTKWQNSYGAAIQTIKTADQRAQYPGLSVIQSDTVY